MLRVISVVDKVGTALDRLANGVKPYNSNLDYHVVDFHPKRPSPEQIWRFESLAKTADIIDYQYFRTAEKIREMFPWAKEIPSLLTHNNAYSHKEGNWNDYQVNIGNNHTIYKELQDITVTRVEEIPLAVNPYFWEFNQDYKFERSVIMVANRIEGKKGILPVALACKELDIKMYLVGAISDSDYWHEVMATEAVHFAQQISDPELRDLYHKAGLHICNSVDNFESGTLPILEAIFCGVPVISRNVGHVTDFKTDNNIVINDHEPDDVEHLATLIEATLADRKKLETMRHEAWMSIKDKNFERRAYQYQKLYRELLPDKPVSVIVPVAGKPEITRACLNAIANQTYKNIEVIVIDDGTPGQENTIMDFGATVSMPVRYIQLGGKQYNLAKARNLGAIESTSEILIFCDQRQIMDSDCITQFVDHLKPRYWLYGNKGSKKDFVENLSCISRDEFITFGMFNERCDRYGALSQETRARARRQLISLDYCDTAKATPMGKSRNRWTKKIEILESKNMLWKCGLL